MGEISNVYSTGEDYQNASVAPYNESMATLSTQIMNNGYDGLFSWEYSCDPVNDEACIGQKAIAEGIQAAAQAKTEARTLKRSVLGNAPEPSVPEACMEYF